MKLTSQDKQDLVDAIDYCTDNAYEDAKLPDYTPTEQQEILERAKRLRRVRAELFK